MSPDSPYPSRRVLREQGLTTGSIQALTETGSIPPQPQQVPPMTRRERRERERLAETGSLPRPVPDPQPMPAPPVSDSPSDAPQIAPAAPASPSDRSSAALGTVMPAAAPATRPLTRRERREMERRGEQVPETGVIPAVAAKPVTLSPETVSRASAPDVAVESEPRVSPGVIGEEPQVSPQPVALPPVFAPTPSPEVHTASSQEVGVASDQANALILPVAPAMDLSGPMGDTGEVLVTGNFPLPKQVSEQAITGIVDVDSDEYDVTDTGTFSNPIRATQAVSSRSLELAPPMIKKPRWGAASIVLAFSSAVLAVAAVGLLALALMTDLIVLPIP